VERKIVTGLRKIFDSVQNLEQRFDAFARKDAEGVIRDSGRFKLRDWEFETDKGFGTFTASVTYQVEVRINAVVEEIQQAPRGVSRQEAEHAAKAVIATCSDDLLQEVRDRSKLL
jgi:hypothetical protein